LSAAPPKTKLHISNFHKNDIEQKDRKSSTIKGREASHAIGANTWAKDL
jgi:hypothetical protein